MTVVDLAIPGFQEAEPIGKGGNGSVYRANDVDHDRWVAIKVLHGMQDEATLRRFDRERKTMGRLSAHEGIVTILTSGISAKGEPYLVMPLLTDGSLEDRLRLQGPVSWAEAVTTAVAVADTVAAAHAANVIHRDLKPGNILLGPGGKPLVADFGISQILDPGVAGTARLMVSPHYTAPDLFDRPPPATIDVYALGATLYELAIGTPPYVQGSEESIIDFIGRVGDEPLPDLRRHGVPEVLMAMLEGALAKVAADRPSSMHEFAASLRTTLDVLDRGGSHGPTGDGPPRVSDHDPTVSAPSAPTVVAPTVPAPAAPADPTVSASADPTIPAANPTVVAPGVPTIPAEVDSTVAAAVVDEEPIIDWQPHIDLVVEVDDLADTTEVLAEGVRWCFSHRGVYLIVSVDGGRFVQLLVEQNGDAYAETSRASLALEAGLGWMTTVAGHEDIAEVTLPLGMAQREQTVVDMLVSTIYRVHGFDHTGDIEIQTGLAGSGSPVLGVVFDRDVELQAPVATEQELEELVWHSVLWSQSTRQVSVTLDFSTATVERWQAVSISQAGELELRSCRPKVGASLDPNLGWEVDPADPARFCQRLVGDDAAPRALGVLMETFGRGLGVEPPTTVQIQIVSTSAQ